MVGALGAARPVIEGNRVWVQATGEDAARVCRALKSLDFVSDVNVGTNYVECTIT